MTPEEYKLLTEQFDQRRSRPTAAPPDFDDAERQQEWEILELAVEAIRLHALTEQVKRGRLLFEAEASDGSSLYESVPVLPNRKSPSTERGADVPAGEAEVQPAIGPAVAAVRAPVRRLMAAALRIAAVFLLVIVGAVLIKFAGTRPEGVFEKNYSAYELNVTRGADAPDALERAYRDKNWAAVYSAFRDSPAKTQKEYFLTAMAHMQQKDYYKAIGLLKTLIRDNQSAAQPYFEDEAEYYLAMNYLATGQTAPALALLNKIKADPRHVFNARVRSMSQLDLRILQVN